MAETTDTDQIYRAAIEAAGHLDRSAAPDPMEACRALVSALEHRALSVRVVDVPAGSGAAMPMISVGDTDGIVVTVAGDENAIELGSLLHQYRWQRAHRITFTAQALGIKTTSV